MSERSKASIRSRGRGRLAGLGGALLLVMAVATACGTSNDSKNTLTTTSLTPGSGASTTNSSPGTVSKPGTLEGFSSPESVLFTSDRWFVSNVGPKVEPTAKDGDGFLTELNSVGTLTARKAMPRAGDPPLNAPKGMAHTDNRVFVADIDRVVGYDIDTHGQVFEAPLGGDEPALLNDMALLDPRTLLVSDTMRGIVYRLDLETKKFEPLASGIPGANGVAVDSGGKIAYVVGTGADFSGGDLWKLDLSQNPVVPQRIGTLHGVFDGLAILSNGNLVISDWISSQGTNPGTVTVYRPDGSEVAKVTLPDNLHGPADFTVDPAGRNLWIPALPDNRVVIVPLPSGTTGTSVSLTAPSTPASVTVTSPAVPSITTPGPSPAPATTP
ncbi:SMP-30/gluconolactonase/LRE family protein [Nocardia sp. NPDC051030]|uniref:SMP-30/gluconolactonase/LRE family protein n=1 Tax=Nocardia sp. NPDC051030 TaxID=3155162 RepID=UPI0034458D45